VARVRTFTPDEARALVPRVKPLLADLRDAFHAYRFAREQVDELSSFGEGEGGEAKAWAAKAEEADRRVRTVLDELNALGADVKDPVLGLIDFPALRRDGEMVLLCYRDDEDTIQFWHPMDTGFAGRRPISEL
jgi:hypothetical protein